MKTIVGTKSITMQLSIPLFPLYLASEDIPVWGGLKSCVNLKPKEIISMATSRRIFSTFLSVKVPTTNAIMIVEKIDTARGEIEPSTDVIALRLRNTHEWFY